MESADNLRLASLTLTVTEKCNLRCSYCTVPFERARVMSNQVLDAALGVLDRHADAAETTLSFYGGEPMLALDRCQRAVDGARRAFSGKRRLRVMIPTNTLALDESSIAWCRDQRIELALSVDGDAGETERRFADGRPVAPELLARLPELLDALPRKRLLARMTVTPDNVYRLASNVRRLARLGFSRIVYLVAFERAWDEAAIEAWGREHRRIGTWLVGAAGAGKPIPDLPTWRAIEERLLAGRARGSCGAGRRIAAVSTDGGLYPCYRLVFRGNDPKSRLGDVKTGFTNREALAEFAAFDPNRMKPEDGNCASCAAADGCTHACPALGLEMLDDLNAVPAIACRLMREQVAAIRPYAALVRRPARRTTSRRIAAAFVAAAVTTASAAAASCGGGTSSDRGLDAGSGGSSGDGSVADVFGPGVCAQWDGGGGICPVWVDSGSGGYAGSGGSGGGICDIYDASDDVTDDAAQDDTGAAGYGGGGGLCAYFDDSGGGGGLC